MKSQDYKFFIGLSNKIKKEIIETQDNYHVVNGKIYNMNGEEITDKFHHELVPKTSENTITSFISNNKMYDYQKEHGGFIFMFYQLNKSIHQLTGTLSNQDITRLLYLSTYISYQSNKIQYDNGRSIPEKELMKMMRLQKRQYNEFIKRLKDNNLVGIIDNELYISSDVCWNGSINIKQLKDNDISYTRLFKKTVRELYDNATTREFNRLSILYMILPYVNLYTNIVCYNPDEIDNNKVLPMTLLDLSKKLGYTNYTKLKQSMYKTIIDNQYVFGFFYFDKDKRTQRIVVNPKVVYAGDYDNLKVLTALFSDAKVK